MYPREIEFGVVVGGSGILGCDAFALKYPRKLNKNDEELLQQLGAVGVGRKPPKPHRARVYRTRTGQTLGAVVLVNVPQDELFEYSDARKFGRKVLKALRADPERS